MSKAHFTKALFDYLRDLGNNNDRAWFEANRDRYEKTLRAPCLAFIDDLEPRLLRVSPQFRVDARSLFRIHRDVRFSKDKSPYKTHCGMQFRHRAGRDVHAPGFYLHLEPSECFAGLGLWRPETAVARGIRNTIEAHPTEWKRAAYGKKFVERFSLGGESLKRPPRGVDPEHPYLDDLRRKDFIAIAPFTRKDVTSSGFLDLFVDTCRRGAPFMSFLCRAVDVPFE